MSQTRDHDDGQHQDRISHLLTREERLSAGKARRERVSRESHAEFAIDPDRDPLPILTITDPQRVASLVPERYRRMAQSPFAFYRGAAALMAHDLTLAPRAGLRVQACGDCHLMNFGVYSSPEGNVLFDINDFDETYPGVDFMVDLKRLVASVTLAAQAAGTSEEKAQAIARATAKSYRGFMKKLAGRSPLRIWQTRMDLKDEIERLGDAHLETKILSTLWKAEKKGKQSKAQPQIDIDALRFDDEPGRTFHVFPDGTPVRPVLSPDARVAYESTLAPESATLLNRYALRDVAFKVVGIGSVGTYCAVGLWATEDGELVVLQLKQAWQSAISGLGPGTLQDGHQGQRVVDGQRALQAASDNFLGWTQDASGRQFYMRQLKNRWLGSIGELIEGEALEAYARLCGRTLARAHARTGDPAMISGYLGRSDLIDEALGAFATAYARQTKFDWEKLIVSNLVPHD